MSVLICEVTSFFPLLLEVICWDGSLIDATRLSAVNSKHESPSQNLPDEKCDV